MTLPLRRKRPTTAPAPSTRARTPASAIALSALILFAGVAPAQQAPWTQPPPQPILRTYFQQITPQPAQAAAPFEEKPAEQTIQLEPPGPDRLFRLESEDALKERWRQELKNSRPGDRQIYPDEPVLTREKYFGRNWQARTLYVEPNYLCYRRLLFEQPNMERYGWDLGPISVPISGLAFLGDFLTLPYHAFTDPFRCCECNAGYCLPGDPVPLLLYPPQLSTTGALAETATILTLIAIFP
jgi:hypothetical protein